MRKKRILFCTEATFLNTGYSTYTREVMRYLHSTGKYELAELAAYGQRNDPRGFKLPWKYYGVQPNRDFEPVASREEMESFESNPINQFGAFIFEDVCLDFKPDIVFDIRDFWMIEFVERSPFRNYFKWCFPKGTPVITDFGYSKPIEEYWTNESILSETVTSHLGNIKFVNKASSHYYQGLMTKIKAEGMAEPLICTEDHEILVLKRSHRIWDRSLKRYMRVKDSLNLEDKKFVASSDIKNGDYLMLPIMNLGGGLEIDDESLWIIGHFVADGSAREKYRISFSFHSSELETIKRVEKYFINENGDKKIDGNKTTLRFNGKHLVDKFSKFYDENSLKVLPLEYKNLNKKQAKVLLDGYFAGDGCVTRTNHNTPSIEMFSKSKVLARQIADIGRALGYCFRLNGSREQDGYSIRLSGQKCFDFSKELVSNISKSTTFAKKDFNRVIIKDGYFLMPVTSIETYEDNLQVYDIEVDVDHSFLTHCAVHNCIMPTVDAEPQARQWIATFKSADAVFTYSEWAGEVIKKQSGDTINYLGTAPPSANEAYTPMDQSSCRAFLGLDKDIKIVGTVMRNQRRKLYPDLFKAFSLFLSQVENPEQYKLYCHTSYPDLGWDIPELLLEYGLSSDVYFTYQCPETNKVFASLFAGAICESPFTGNFNATMCNVRNGASYEQLAKIINCFDLYAQYANSEGFGLPQVEAAACGVPVMATDYSAMKSVVRNLCGRPIELESTYKELETGCLRAKPSNEDAARGMLEFFSMDQERQNRLKDITLASFKEHYQWDLTGSRLEKCFDEFQIIPENEGWESEPKITNPKPFPSDIPKDVTHKQLAQWLIMEVLGEPDKINSYFESRLIRDLMYGQRTSTVGGMYHNESSAAFDGKANRQPFNLQLAYEEMLKICQKRNYWENKRVKGK
jgi:glycosyltransferase involved in cell wall biosynthesis